MRAASEDDSMVENEKDYAVEGLTALLGWSGLTRGRFARVVVNAPHPHE